NRGYGAALRSGLFSAQKELVFYTDADGQFDIEKLKDFVDAIKRYDLIVGYRIQRQDIWLRKLYSFVYNKLIQLLFGLRVRDIDCSFKLFRRDCLRKLSIERDNFFVDTELLLKAKNNNCRFREIGIKHRPRRKGKSTVKFKHIFVTLGDILYFYPRRKYGRS
ncbi:MAG: glycosyltransferase family 2 protein, partial [Candidatus Omnitrophica bacterium]|nr:glycosyltransferase family 2 protein [Candidatus Omnitrophota bacterium]